MSFIELKKILVSKIAETEDEELLKMVYRLLNSGSDVYQLSEEQASILNEAQAEYKAGNYITHDELLKELNKWLKD